MRRAAWLVGLEVEERRGRREGSGSGVRASPAGKRCSPWMRWSLLESVDERKRGNGGV
jgi:hypothetical protein